ncbi:hypothetical protein O6P43_017189 [Quillaja saponaria]|uniref:Uncharacterized protein n=1 Tax=Quillaja saponaria TaxID=32244 RepID=A0AAD7LPM7_QUISA|nr:hypothetical protein O6P43_017189 [Quillaja saponaria]
MHSLTRTLAISVPHIVATILIGHSLCSSSNIALFIGPSFVFSIDQSSHRIFVQHSTASCPSLSKSRSNGRNMD